MEALDNFIIKLLTVIVNPLINLMFAAALVYFLWGVVQYIKGADSEPARETGREHIMWGLVGMFIMVAAVGIIMVARRTIFGR